MRKPSLNISEFIFTLIELSFSYLAGAYFINRAWQEIAVQTFNMPILTYGQCVSFVIAIGTIPAIFKLEKKLTGFR